MTNQEEIVELGEKFVETTLGPIPSEAFYPPRFWEWCRACGAERALAYGHGLPFGCKCCADKGYHIMEKGWDWPTCHRRGNE